MTVVRKIRRYRLSYLKTTMWANAHRDGRCAEYIWRPLFNATKYGCPVLEYHAVTKARRESRWNLFGYPKVANTSQPLVGRPSTYYEHMCERYCCLRIFCLIVHICLSCEFIARQSCAMVPRWRFFYRFLGFCISRQRTAHFRHSNFALGPHHV